MDKFTLTGGTMTLSKPLLTLTTGLALALLTLSSCSGAATTPVTPVTTSAKTYTCCRYPEVLVLAIIKPKPFCLVVQLTVMPI